MKRFIKNTLLRIVIIAIALLMQALIQYAFITWLYDKLTRIEMVLDRKSVV